MENYRWVFTASRLSIITKCAFQGKNLHVKFVLELCNRNITEIRSKYYIGKHIF